jgi:hypothetical protein
VAAVSCEMGSKLKLVHTPAHVESEVHANYCKACTAPSNSNVHAGETVKVGVESSQQRTPLGVPASTTGPN